MPLGSRTRPAAAALIALLLPALCHTQTGTADFAANTTPPPLATGEQPTVLHVTVPEVPVTFSVLDGHGKFVNGLDRADVRLYDGHTEVPRLTFFESQTEIPLKIAVVIDLSGSVKKRVKFEAEVTSDFLKRTIRDKDSAYVIGFNDRPYVTGVHNSVAELQQIHERRPEAGTAIFDAMLEATHTLGSTTSTQRSVLILITDGEDNCSKADEQQVMRTLSETGTTVLVLDTGSEFTGAPRESASLLRRFAEHTGGEVIQATSFSAVRKAFARAEQALRSQYALAYRPPELKPDGAFHRLKLKVRAGLHVRARKGYYAPTAE